jgi:hypothetical protein
MGDRAFSERWLGWTGEDGAAVAASKLRSMRRLVLLTLACEAWMALGYVPYSSHPGRYGLVAAVLTGCALLGWRDRFGLAAVTTAGLLLLGVVVSVFPDNANHHFLALLLLALIALAGSPVAGAPPEARAALQSMRWIAAIGVFWAGVWKLWYGHWLGGEFLAYRLANDPGFEHVLGFLVPAAERARLAGLGLAVGAGPYRPEAPWLVAVSNATWMAEIALPFGLLFAPTRRGAMVATIALFLAIQLGAREIFFGGLMVGLLLLYAEHDRVARALPWIGGVYLLWMLRREWGPLVEGGLGG